MDAQWTFAASHLTGMALCSTPHFLRVTLQTPSLVVQLLRLQTLQRVSTILISSSLPLLGIKLKNISSLWLKGLLHPQSKAATYTVCGYKVPPCPLQKASCLSTAFTRAVTSVAVMNRDSPGAGCKDGLVCWPWVAVQEKDDITEFNPRSFQVSLHVLN